MIDESRGSGLWKILAVVSVSCGALSVAGCGLDVQPDYLVKTSDKEPYVYESELKRETIFGEGGFNLLDLGGTTKGGGGGGGAGLGVNSFLWRASLDTISFMPVNSADPFGGVILTDWHSPNEAPGERFKLNVYILDRTLRADGVRVAVFRQVQDRSGNWRDAGVPGGTGTKIEDAILIRARQLRNQSLSK